MPDTHPRPVSARLIAAGFGFLILAMGVVFIALLWGSYQRAKQTHTWTATPCHIVRSESEPFQPSDHSPTSYHFRVEFAYEVDGKTLSSTNYKRPRRNEWTSKHEGTVDKLVHEFPAGSDTTCYVDPADPAMAVLKRESKAPLYTIWFPGLFVAGGLGIIATSFLTKRPKSSTTPSA
ncbi:MAG: DUF3592 domain-containing protein [Verrucomicrobiales bacterium]|nr:DUF3592 domain-containing protein [Verrucomicrobiales bacterium]